MIYETELKLDVSYHTKQCPFASKSNAFGTAYQFLCASGLISIFMAYWMILSVAHSTQHCIV